MAEIIFKYLSSLNDVLNDTLNKVNKIQKNFLIGNFLKLASLAENI